MRLAISRRACSISASGCAPDLTLVLHDYGTAILFAHGTGSIREALGHVRWPVHLQVQPDALEEVARHATVTNVKHMWRMAWDGGETAIADGVTRLGSNDVGALKRLYADGETSGESPDFFYDAMVPAGVFFGVYEGADLVAAAGTHLFAPDGMPRQSATSIHAGIGAAAA